MLLEYPLNHPAWVSIGSGPVQLERAAGFPLYLLGELNLLTQTDQVFQEGVQLCSSIVPGVNKVVGVAHMSVIYY